LQDEFVFSTEEALKIVREAELKLTEKKPCGRPYKWLIEEVEEEVKEEELEGNLSRSELELAECMVRRSSSTPCVNMYVPYQLRIYPLHFYHPQKGVVVRTLAVIL
jgi:hypothetical protein